MSHREIALLIALAISTVGFLIEFFRAQGRLQGFWELRKDLRALAVYLEGEIDRDGDDLLVRGHYGHWPVLVRLSRSEYEAGASVQMPVPANVSLFCYPVSHQGEEGEVPLAISDDRFMAHFRLSTNNTPLEVSMILSSPAVLKELIQITDSQTYLALNNRALELAEAVIVPEGLGPRLMNRIRGMARIASEAMEVHGGSAAMGISSRRTRNWFRVGYLAASAIIVVTIGIAAMAGRPAIKAQAEVIKPVTGIPATLADQLPQLQGWKVADVVDLDPDAGAWLQQQGEKLAGHLTANLDSDQSADDAYIFKRPPGPPGTNPNRFSLFIAGKERYDAEMPEIAAMARISKDALGNVQWRGRRPPDTPAAGGIIVVQRFRDPGSAIVFYMSGTRLITAVPKDFRALSLQ
jgi:hypothetical protein